MADSYSPSEYQAVCEIYVSSIEHSLAFYKSLGFRVDWTVPEIFAQLAWDGCLLFLKQKKGQALANDGVRPGSGNIRLMVPNVDEKYAECQKLGIKIQQTLGDRLYVLRDFIVEDPDGFGVRFGTFLPDRGRIEQQLGPGAANS